MASNNFSNQASDEVESAPGIIVQAADESMGDAAAAVDSAAGQEFNTTAFDAAGDAGEAASSIAGDDANALLIGNVDPSDPTEIAKFKYALEYVEGIGPVYAGKLKAIGLLTCLDLLRAGATRKGREETAEKSGISGKLILEWVNHLDLYRIKGVGSEYADLLEATGVDTVMELGQRNPSNLFEKMNLVNAEMNLVRKMPTAAQIEDWVSQASHLPRVITY
jgi:predicted flap endonuclease-1-like 5' DNA nuclease